MATLQWASIERGRRRAGRGQRRNYTGIARRFCRAGAPTRANHALPSPLFFPLPLKKQCASVKRGGCRAGRGQRKIHTGIARRFCRAGRGQRRIHTGIARRLCRAIHNGGPLHSVHALPSSFFSLFPTMARTTFYPLLPSPYSYWIIVRCFTLCGRCRGFLPWRFPFFRGCGGLPSSFCPSRIF